MKHVSAYFDKVEQAEEKFAWWPVRTSFSNKFLWLKKYVKLSVYYDDSGRPPIKDLNWTLIYTPKEYTMYLLLKDTKKNISGQEFTGV